MEEEHTQTIQLIQSESKAKIITLENSIDELKEKLQLGQKNTAVLSEILADNDKKINTLQAESVTMKNENTKLQSQLNSILEGTFFVFFEPDSDTHYLMNFSFIFFSFSLCKNKKQKKLSLRKQRKMQPQSLANSKLYKPN